MKSAGLSSTQRKTFRHLTKTIAFAANQEGHFAAKEKQRILLQQAQRAQIERQKREAETEAAAVPSPETE